MLNSPNTNIEHIIAKIDNDFNIDNSDWIPRIAAWVIEALSILKCARTEEKYELFNVEDRKATLTGVDINKAKIYCKKGCEIESADRVIARLGMLPSTGEQIIGRDEQIAIPIDPTQYPTEYVTTSKQKALRYKNLYYVKLPNNIIELNFDTDAIYVKYKTIKTEKSTIYDCDLPVIPNNGLVIEAIGYYCMYKILCRGYKHPVMNLSASQYGTNPFFMWNHLKDEARRSLIIDEQGEVIDDGGMWRKSFFNFTFNPRD